MAACAPTCAWPPSAPPAPGPTSGRAGAHQPRHDLRRGLGLFGLRDLDASTVAASLREVLRPGGDPRGRNVLRRDAVDVVGVRSERALALQIDGEHVGERRDVAFRSVPDAVRVVV